MTTLFDYEKQVQRFLREARQDMLNPEDIVDYINRARREIAMRCQCIRRLTPISGPVVSVTVTAAGAGYTAPTCTITAPDFPSGAGATPNGAQATALAILQGGSIAAIDIQYGGDGYFQPQMTITDPTGTGATASLTLAPINIVNQGQEQYRFADINLSMFPGVGAVYMIKSISLIYSSYRFSLPMYDFSTYQAMIRQYPYQYQYIPTFSSQYGQGVDGSFFLYPLPSQVYQIEYDCFCLPQDLTDDQSVEALPMPWSEGVPYWAASLAYGELQNFNASKFYLDMFDKVAQRYSNYARPGRVTNPYGRYVLPFILGALEMIQQMGNGWL